MSEKQVKSISAHKSSDFAQQYFFAHVRHSFVICCAGGEIYVRSFWIAAEILS